MLTIEALSYLHDVTSSTTTTTKGKSSKLYRLADHIGACTVNVYREGDQHFWHFDESPFSVTLSLQAPEGGGAFNAIANTRAGTRRVTPPDVVDKIEEGVADGIGEELPFSVGTLSIFGGHRTLHEVTPVVGERRRLVAVMCFSEAPDEVNTPECRLRFWGRDA